MGMKIRTTVIWPRDEDEDYAFPLDAIKEESVSLYENPHQPIRDQYQSCEPMRSQDDNDDRIQERIVGTEVSISPPQQRSPTNTHLGDRRKLSLGVILRKLSTGSQPARERKTSLQEKRLSSALSKLITPIFERRTLGERSYQVNSLSWEFLNRDAEEEVRDKLGEKHPSTDGLYESEFDSSSTLESTNSSTSARQQQQHHVNNIVIQ